MSTPELPKSIEAYFFTKACDDAEATIALFLENATVWDNGENLELKGIDAIRRWMTGTVAEYKLTTEVRSAEQVDGETVVRTVVSGDFPGSPYEFAYRFKLAGDRIAELAIDPIGSLAP